MLLRYKLASKFSQPARRYFATSIANRVLIETHELQELMDTQRDKLSIVNATLVRGMIDPKAEHIKERIPTSVFFDFEELSDASNPVPLMLPS